jgi:hypothetical protein
VCRPPTERRASVAAISEPMARARSRPTGIVS